MRLLRWLIPAILVFVGVIGGVTSNLVATDLDFLREPYRLWIWLIFGIALIAAVAWAIWGASRLDEPSSSDSFLDANRHDIAVIGGNVSNSPVITSPSNVVQQGQGHINIRQARDITIVQPSPQPQGHQEAPTFTPPQIHQACDDITRRLANDLIEDKVIIPREHLQASLDTFLTSFKRYCLLQGPSGVGKSIVMAVEAGRLLESGWAALLMRAQGFSLEYLSELVVQDALSQHAPVDWRQIVVEPWRGELLSGPRGFILLIDGLDEADLDAISREMLKLHEGLGQLPPDRLKVIVSCRDLAWKRLDQQLPFWQDMWVDAHQAPHRVEIIQITDFQEEELDSALQAIGATELLTPRPPGEWADPHVQVVRDLLKHPATFALYAGLHASGDVSSIQNLTWSRLIERYMQRALDMAGAQCDVRPEALREQLIELASLARQEKSRDLYLRAEMVKQAMPDMEIDRLNPAQSRYAALRENGILHELPAPGGKRLIGFHIPDFGSYLLSFTLEKQAQSCTKEEFRELATAWLCEGYNYPPLQDAILAWIDRLASNPEDSLLLILLDTLIEGPFRNDVVFRLLRPTIVGSLFAALRQKASHHFYDYAEAAKAVRPSPEALEEIRRYLHDRSPRARQLAAQLTGFHRDARSVSELIELLEDYERAVREAASAALGRIGRAAVPPLLVILGDSSQSAEYRSRCLSALRGVGFRDNDVSAVLSGCLRDGQAGEMALLRSALLAAAHLRDGRQAIYATRALSSHDWRVVEAAAKLLTETADPAAFFALREALRRCSSSERASFEHVFVSRQVLAALTRVGGTEATNIVLNLLRDSLLGSGGIEPIEAIWAADNLGLPDGRRLLLHDILSRLDNTAPDQLLWHSLNRLSSTWLPEHLAVMTEATRQLTDQGVDVARRMVDAVIQGIQVQDDHSLRDHHAQSYALGTLAKCQPVNFVPEVRRLLTQAGWPFDLEICDMLWVAGDSQAEAALLRKLEQPPSQDSSAWLLQSRIIRALGTCGTERGTNAVLDYLRSEPTVTITLPEEAIFPLVQRRMLNRRQLRELVQEVDASIQGRITGLTTLGIMDAQGNKDLFRAILHQSEDETLRGYAVRMLGVAYDKSSVPQLRQLLRETNDAFVAEQTAWALSRLNAYQAIGEIEQAFSEYAHTENAFGLITALANFKKPSSLQVLKDALPRSRFVHVIIETLGAFLSDAEAKQIILERLETWRGGNIDLGEQCPPIRALARHDPNLLLKRVLKLYGDGRLDRSAREELARLIPILAKGDSAERTALLAILKLLVCDQYLPVREQTAQAFSRIDSTLCLQLYNELRHVSDPWEQACAVNTLGFWGNNESEIQSDRHADALLIRRAGDAALEMLRRRCALQHLVDQYCSTNNMARLSAYLALKEQGDEQTIWALHRAVQWNEPARVFLRQLEKGVKQRLRDERRKRADDEQKFLSAPGTVWFN